MRRFVLHTILLGLCAGSLGCGALEFVRYVVWTDAPELNPGEVILLPGLGDEAMVARRPDGLWRIEAASERDAIHLVGYLQARDRIAQLDIFRHMARGELAALMGNRAMGAKSTLELDVLNRFLGFRERGAKLYEATSPGEQVLIDAFAEGVNAWIAEGPLPLEHRLLGVDSIRPWTAEDSLAIYAFIMHGLGGNADREVRRLRIACQAGLAAVDRIWPHQIEFSPTALPESDWPRGEHTLAPAVPAELEAELAAHCDTMGKDAFQVFDRRPAAAANSSNWISSEGLARVATLLADGISASNNWAVAGAHTGSGMPILSSDPHLPHMNPPIVWGMEVIVGDWHVAGFTLPGLHRVVFGHNGHVAFGATTNHVDRQDLVIHRAMHREGSDGHAEPQGYEVEGRFVPFELREELFEIRGSDAVKATVRFTRDGPLLGDIDLGLAQKIPLTALRRAPMGHAMDLDAARLINHARNGAEFSAGLDKMGLGCSSWLYADADGEIGYRSPCNLPVRRAWRGTFPIPGWLDRYRSDSVYPKEQLPRSTRPLRGWLATSNNQIIPSRRFPSTYNNDASSPNRFLRVSGLISERIEAGEPLSVAQSAAMQLDTAQANWAGTSASLVAEVCAEIEADLEAREVSERTRREASRLCAWDGDMAKDSVEATLYTLLTHAMLDRALADELDGESGAEIWQYTQSLLQFESNVAWLWSRPRDAPVWDDARTPQTEMRGDILGPALEDAVAEASKRWGDDPEDWVWGQVRPFVLSHLFAGNGGLAGMLLNSDPIALGGGNETVFKQQFPRSDREQMKAAVGPPLRLTVDLGDPWKASFSLAGGQSGWAGTRHYADLLDDWAIGQERPLTPPAAEQDVVVSFRPTR